MMNLSTTDKALFQALTCLPAVRTFTQLKITKPFPGNIILKRKNNVVFAALQQSVLPQKHGSTENTKLFIPCFSASLAISNSRSELKIRVNPCTELGEVSVAK